MAGSGCTNLCMGVKTTCYETHSDWLHCFRFGQWVEKFFQLLKIRARDVQEFDTYPKVGMMADHNSISPNSGSFIEPQANREFGF